MTTKVKDLRLCAGGLYYFATPVDAQVPAGPWDPLPYSLGQDFRGNWWHLVRGEDGRAYCWRA